MLVEISPQVFDPLAIHRSEDTTLEGLHAHIHGVSLSVPEDSKAYPLLATSHGLIISEMAKRGMEHIDITSLDVASRSKLSGIQEIESTLTVYLPPTVPEPSEPLTVEPEAPEEPEETNDDETPPIRALPQIELHMTSSDRTETFTHSSLDDLRELVQEKLDAGWSVWVGLGDESERRRVVGQKSLEASYRWAEQKGSRVLVCLQEASDVAPAGSDGILEPPPSSAASTLETIRQEGDKWVVYSKDGTKKLGTFDSEDAAKKHLKRIEFFKHLKQSARPKIHGHAKLYKLHLGAVETTEEWELTEDCSTSVGWPPDWQKILLAEGGRFSCQAHISGLTKDESELGLEELITAGKESHLDLRLEAYGERTANLSLDYTTDFSTALKAVPKPVQAKAWLNVAARGKAICESEGSYDLRFSVDTGTYKMTEDGRVVFKGKILKGTKTISKGPDGWQIV